MGERKERDCMLDTFRGILMWSIPISHFTRVAGHFSQDSLSGVIYITINVFVMQTFVFLSGYFSKKPERARETAFHTFLWPYLIGIPFFYCVRQVAYDDADLCLDVPPFALWYLLALFFYRFFLKNYIKVPYIMEISLLIYLFAGQAPFLAEEWALGRTASYFPFFLMGYYCDKETLDRIRSLKKSRCLALGTVLLACSCILAFCVGQLPVGFYLLKSPACDLGISWYWDIIGRLAVFVLACGWIVLMLNILPRRMNYMAYVGMNTMPVYMLHLIVRYLVKEKEITFGILPDNWAVYYAMIFALAGLCVFVFTTAPVIRGYDFVVEGSYKVFCRLLCKIHSALAWLHRLVMAVCRGVIGLIAKDGTAPSARRQKIAAAGPQEIAGAEETDANSRKTV